MVLKGYDTAIHQFNVQKGLAKHRGIAWELEFWEWHQIWQDSGHFHERGNRKGEWVMARNGDVGPYSASNVKIVRVETNNSDATRNRQRRRS